MRISILAFGAAASLMSVSAFAQTTTTTADPAMNADTTMMTPPVVEEDDNEFPWGLLGLLGLAGLLGRNKRDVHVDNTTRRNV